MQPEFTDYIAQLSENERGYAQELLSALFDEVGSIWPEAADWSLSFFRSLEILGVVNHFVDEDLTRKMKSQLISST